MNLPIVRLEVENMRHTIQVALSQYLTQMDTDIQASLDSVCTPENVTRIVKETAEREIEGVIREEMQKFFRYGKGRAAVQDAVKAILERDSDGI